jgi:hypothetical protein
MWRNFSLFVVPLGIVFAVACSSSSNNGGAPSDASSTAIGDANIVCNGQPCSGVCCFSSTQAACTAKGACPAAYLTCSGKSSCPSGQSCCFAFSDSGATGLGAAMFTTECMSSCPSDQYELCDTMADCPSGSFCTMGQYTTYCAVPPEGGGFPFLDGGFPFPSFDASAGDAPAATVDAGGAQDAPTE